MTDRRDFVRVDIIILDHESELGTLMMAGLELIFLKIPTVTDGVGVAFMMPIGVIPALCSKADIFMMDNLKRMAKRHGYKLKKLDWKEETTPSGLVTHLPHFRLEPRARNIGPELPRKVLPEGHLSACLH